MFAKINHFFFQKYENSDFIIQQRVKILLSICVILIFVLLTLTVSFLILGEKDQGIIIPVAIAGLILIVCIVLIKYGYFYIAAHTILVVPSSLLWITMVTESGALLARLDTVAIAIGFISFTALLVSRRSAAIIGYTVANILLFLGCTFYLQRQLVFSDEVMFEYAIDSIIGIMIVGVISFLVFTINKRARQKADESMKIADTELEKNRELNRTLEQKVIERTEKLEAAIQIIRELAIRDELTGMFNRRHLLELLEYEKNRSSRGGGFFCLAMLDIDHFKKVNDVYGHLAGDEVLRTVATMIDKTLRNTEFCGRYGGEEFLIVMTQTDIKGALIGAERVRTNIENTLFPNLGSDFKVTVSIGLSEYQIREDIDKIIARADEALYLAKKGGRNRVELSG
jgi:diguanylate cyclase (GGDEF)-like protein